MIELLLAVIAGLAGATLGRFGGDALPSLLARYPDLPYATWTQGVLTSVDVRTVGGLLGAVLGIFVVLGLLRLRGRDRTMASVTWRAAVALLLVGFIVIGAQHVRLLALEQLGLNSAAPALEFEIRLPATQPPAHDAVQIELHTDQNQAIAALKADWLGAEGQKPIVRGAVALDFRTANRVIVLSLPDEPARLFRLRLPAAPGAMTDFSAWQQVDEIEDKGRSRKPGPGDDFAIRFRVY